MMHCYFARRAISDALDGAALPPRKRRHIDGCGRCQLFELSVSAFHDRLAAGAGLAVPPADLEPGRPRPARLAWVGLAAAAAAAGVALYVAPWGAATSDPPTRAASVSPPAPAPAPASAPAPAPATATDIEPPPALDTEPAPQERSLSERLALSLPPDPIDAELDRLERDGRKQLHRLLAIAGL